eukprot:c9742_g1_i2.p1 GENE.c9742_g1_i2~~c9742_g1_i2.p1  ORF type:complete len:178 (-),score=24.01 c9742_g1_i2:66-599(-)
MDRVLAFLRLQLHSIFSGESHSHNLKGAGDNPAQPFTWLERGIIAASCFAYAGPAIVWAIHDHPIMSTCFSIVTVASFLADGIRIDSRLIRSLDRIFATLAAVGTIWHLSTTLANALLALPALIFSCWWLYKSRYIAKHEPWRRSMYVFFHTGWHVVGSLFICLGIFFVLGDLAVRT